MLGLIKAIWHAVGGEVSDLEPPKTISEIEVIELRAANELLKKDAKHYAAGWRDGEAKLRAELRNRNAAMSVLQAENDQLTKQFLQIGRTAEIPTPTYKDRAGKLYVSDGKPARLPKKGDYFHRFGCLVYQAEVDWTIERVQIVVPIELGAEADKGAEAKPKRKLEFYLNIYPEGVNTALYAHDSRELANDKAGRERIGCQKVVVEVEEGRFDA